MSETANAAQQDFWGGDPGRRWVAHHRDLDILHDVVRARLIARANLSVGAKVLDVGCGGGATTLSAAREVSATGHVDGIDISQPLLSVAEAARKAAALDHVSFHHADAQTYPFAARYDVILSRFGVMFFDDPVAAFANLRRALTPGGRFVAATWAAAQHNPWFSTARKAAVARLGAPAPGDPDAPGPMALQDPDRVRQLLTDAGFQNIDVAPEDIVLHHPEGWDAALRLLPAIGPIAGIMRERSGTGEDLDAILSDMRTRWSSYLTADGLRLPARINLVTATR
ncbi:Demethylmenaquinone methyltransferase [Roseivivax sp. THAF40]|uniref:class I SAM-dependent methyltransferase n=1 Tax=unclassified Roseivivax TaxID=2639302 RepID=UPI00126834F3|nr:MULTISPECIES: methyltransferase domain-containing protein [unclassified Roseivivax]QFS84193.1 Demethylmenaquinone methyltransferase [Roseivivax sp. THAF197b]QFT48021.1 Demethylmenaquinone methyltransferase [Roseivivax sp. THAF40]